MKHPAELSVDTRTPIIQAAQANPSVWTAPVETVIGALSCRWVNKTLPSGKASYVCYWKLNGKAINDGSVHHAICDYYWPEFQKSLDAPQ